MVLTGSRMPVDGSDRMRYTDNSHLIRQAARESRRVIK